MSDSSSIQMKDSAAVESSKKGKRRKGKDTKDTKDTEPKGSEQPSISTDAAQSSEAGSVNILSQSDSSKEDSKPASPKETGVEEKSVVTLVGGEHPLETTWSVYFDKKLPPARQKNADFKHYQSNLQTLGSFSTLEGFWRHYAYLQNPNDIPKDHDLFLFRNHFIPAWESFPNGGAWIVKVRKKNGIISRLWEELAFACISEAFEEPDLVGAVLSCRMREDIISVWNRDNTDNDRRFKIGEKLKDILNLDESTQIAYKPFQSAIKDGSSYRNARQYVYAASSV